VAYVAKSRTGARTLTRLEPFDRGGQNAGLPAAMRGKKKNPQPSFTWSRVLETNIWCT
jgi:hypothetical protein